MPRELVEEVVVLESYVAVMKVQVNVVMVLSMELVEVGLNHQKKPYMVSLVVAVVVVEVLVNVAEVVDLTVMLYYL